MYNDKCPDGATDEQHDTMLAETGQCPWCGLEEDTGVDLFELMQAMLDDGEVPS